MKSFILLITLQVLSLISPPSYAGDGTWPLRLRGEGTWPLRFSGESISLVNSAREPVQTALTILTLNETTGQRTPVGWECSNRGKFFKSSGNVKVGTTIFRIVGICYIAATDSIEVLSQKTFRRGQETFNATSRMQGRVPASQTSSNNLAGRMRVGANAAEAGRYKFEVRKIDRLQPENLVQRY